MKQPLEILMKLKLVFTSYTELFNGSITERSYADLLVSSKKKQVQTFPHKVYAVLCEKIFFSFHNRIHLTRQNRFMRNPVNPCIFAYFAQCRIN